MASHDMQTVTTTANKECRMVAVVAEDLPTSRTTKSVDLYVTTISTEKAVLTTVAHPTVDLMIATKVTGIHTSCRDLVHTVVAEADLNEVATA